MRIVLISQHALVVLQLWDLFPNFAAYHWSRYAKRQTERLETSFRTEESDRLHMVGFFSFYRPKRPNSGRG